jgi:hypothetical protein
VVGCWAVGFGANLLRFFILVVVLGQFDEKKPKTGRLGTRFVNANDAELMGRAHAKFVTVGGKSMVSDG